MSPRKYQHTVIEKRSAPSQTVIKASGIFLIPGESDMDQHIRPITKTGQHDIFSLK